jgi:hypothetical protein
MGEGILAAGLAHGLTTWAVNHLPARPLISPFYHRRTVLQPTKFELVINLKTAIPGHKGAAHAASRR